MIRGDLNIASLQVIDAISRYHAKASNGDSSERVQLQWARAISLSHASDAQIVVTALGRLNEQWTHPRSYSKDKDKIMPFLPTTEFLSGKPWP